MPSIFSQTRLILNTSTVTGQLATVPAGNDHTDGTWQVTDVYPGELFVNYTDGSVSFRTVNGVKSLQVVQHADQQLYSVSVTVPSGSIQALNATPVNIVAAPVSGCIEIVSASIKYLSGSVPFPAGGTLNLVAGNNTATNYSQMQLPASVLTTLPSAGNMYQRMTSYTTGGNTSNLVATAGIYLWASSSQAGSGNGNLIVNALYRIVIA